jgi:TRAP-type C4-dicarboxylate transport system permease small subunit
MMSRLARSADRAIEWLAVITLFAMLVTVMLGVITRALDDPLIWTDELSRYLLVWTAGLGWMIASRRHVHIRITFFIEKLPDRLHRLVEATLQVSVVLFGLLLIWQGLVLVRRNYDLEATSMPLSVAWLYAPLLLIGLWVAAQAVAEFWQALRGRTLAQPQVSEVIE